MPKPDLRMVVLAISPKYAERLYRFLDPDGDGPTTEPDFEVCEAIRTEIDSQLGNLPSAEEHYEDVMDRNAGSRPVPVTVAADVGIQAERIADKMAKAALEAASDFADAEEDAERDRKE